MDNPYGGMQLFDSFTPADTDRNSASHTPENSPPPAPRKAAPRTPRACNHPCPYPDCDRAFTCPHNVKQHVREKHTNERPHRCPVCLENGIEHVRFNRPFCMYRHMATMHGMQVGPGRGGKAREKRLEQSAKARGSKGKERAVSEEESEFNDFDFNQWPAFDTSPTHQSFAINNGAIDNTPKSNNAGPSDASARMIELGSIPVMSPPSVFEAVKCYTCKELFFGHVAVLSHMHSAHNVPQTPFCACGSCVPVPENNGSKVQSTPIAIDPDIMEEETFGLAQGETGEETDREVDVSDINGEMDFSTAFNFDSEVAFNSALNFDSGADSSIIDDWLKSDVLDNLVSGAGTQYDAFPTMGADLEESGDMTGPSDVMALDI